MDIINNQNNPPNANFYKKIIKVIISGATKRKFLFFIFVFLLQISAFILVDTKYALATVETNWTQLIDHAAWDARRDFSSVVYTPPGQGNFPTMFIMGGFNLVSTFKDVWSSSNGKDWAQLTSNAPWSGRRAQSTVVFSDGTGNKMWLIGGEKFLFGSTYIAMNDVWSSSDGVNWTLVTASAPWQPRAWHTSVVYNGRLWVIGGRDGVLFKNDAWSSADGINWIQEPGLPNARAMHTSVVYDNKIWVIGGEQYSGESSNAIFRYNGTSWLKITTANIANRILGAKAVVFNHNGEGDKIWLTGGTGGNSLAYSSDGINWFQPTITSTFPGGKAFHEAFVKTISSGEKMFIVGGDTNGMSIENDVWYMPYEDFTLSISPDTLKRGFYEGSPSGPLILTITSLGGSNSSVSMVMLACTSITGNDCNSYDTNTWSWSISNPEPLLVPPYGESSVSLTVDLLPPPKVPAGRYFFKLEGTEASHQLLNYSNVITVEIVDLAVTLTANPSSGAPPLNDVDLTATVSGSAVGTINYKFDCTDNGTWDYTYNSSFDNPKIVTDACDYAAAGNYTARVLVERDVANPAEGTVAITVSSPTADADVTDTNTNPAAGTDFASVTVNENSGGVTPSVWIWGDNSTDPKAQTLTYGWNCGGVGSIGSSAIANTTFNPPDSISADTDYTCTLTVTDTGTLTDTEDVTITVKNYVPGNKTLTVTLPTGGRISGTGISCGNDGVTSGTDCTESYTHGAASTALTATPNTGAGYSHGNWSADCGTGATSTNCASLTMTADKITAPTFTAPVAVPYFTLTLTNPVDTIVGRPINFLIEPNNSAAKDFASTHRVDFFNGFSEPVDEFEVELYSCAEKFKSGQPDTFCRTLGAPLSIGQQFNFVPGTILTGGNSTVATVSGTNDYYRTLDANRGDWIVSFFSGRGLTTRYYSNYPLFSKINEKPKPAFTASVAGNVVSIADSGSYDPDDTDEWLQVTNFRGGGKEMIILGVEFDGSLDSPTDKIDKCYSPVVSSDDLLVYCDVVEVNPPTETAPWNYTYSAADDYTIAYAIWDDILGKGIKTEVVTIAPLGQFTLTVTSPEVSGNISGGDINCGNGGIVCAEGYALGTAVTLTATPNTGAGYSAGSWTGDCTGATGTDCVLTMDADKSVGATFTAPPLPDLTATPPTPTLVVAGDILFSSTISNIGDAATGVGFINLFQVSLLPNGSSPTNYNSSTASSLSAGASIATSKSITLTAGIYYMRVCADSDDFPGDGAITESDEDNNCSSGIPWIRIDIIDDSGGPPPLPDLTATPPTPTLAVAGDILFSSTISNKGDAATGVGFINLFQVSLLPNGSSPTNYNSSTASSLSAGASIATSKSITLTAGIYYMRVCADSDDFPGDGAITESDEDNNCSSGIPWIRIDISGILDPECNDTIDNDGDGKIDFGVNLNNDPGCSSAIDDDETDLSFIGSCASRHYRCVSSDSGSNENNIANWKWTCTGSDGIPVSCTENKRQPIYRED